MTQAAKHVVKNISEGPRGVHAVDGLVFIEANSQRTVMLTAGEAKSARSTDYFHVSEVGAERAADDDGLDALKVADLKDLAESENVDLGDATKKDDVIAAIRLHREAKAAA